MKKLLEIKILKFIIVTIVIATLVVPFDGHAQTRQRKNTTQTTKTRTSPNSVNSKKPKTSAEAKQRKAAVQKEIQTTQKKIRENDTKVTNELAALGKLQNEIDATTSQINRLNHQLTRLNIDINSLENNIENNEAELSILREEYLKAVKKMRATRRNKSDLAFIFSSNSLNQAMRRMRYLREFSVWKGRQIEEINGKVTDLKNEKEALAKAKADQENALALQRSSKVKLASQYEKHEQLVAELKKNGRALETHLRKKQAEAKELDYMVSQLISEEQDNNLAYDQNVSAQKKGEGSQPKSSSALQKKDAENKLASKSTKPETPSKNKSTDYADARRRAPRSVGVTESVNTKHANNTPISSDGFVEMKGRLPYPSTGSFTVTSRFGRQNVPDMPDVEYDNPGIDAETEAGASARAVYGGKIAGVYLLPGYNTVVIVNHGGYYTVYGNISNPRVKSGDTIEAGTNLGQLALNEDNPGHSTIHFEVWKNREKLNPQEWLR